MKTRSLAFRGRRPRLIPVILITLILCSLGFLSLSRGSRLFQRRTEVHRDQLSIDELWENRQYSSIVEYAESVLVESPLDRDALIYAGYSRFYLAISRNSVEERISDLNSCILYLRRLKAYGGTPSPERLDYVLGKAYLLKGPYWADLAVEYLESSLHLGYLAEDSFEFLGRAYSALGDLETALEWYEKAAQAAPTDRLLLVLAQESFQLGRYDEAAEYYRTVIDNSRDEQLRKRGLSQLGQLYYDVGNYRMAKDVLENLVEIEPDNAESQFLLGETFFALGDTQNARRYWFRVTAIDPRHVGALRRLYD